LTNPALELAKLVVRFGNMIRRRHRPQASDLVSGARLSLVQQPPLLWRPRSFSFAGTIQTGADEGGSLRSVVMNQFDRVP
jgi:hypothetical protein